MTLLSLPTTDLTPPPGVGRTRISSREWRMKIMLVCLWVFSAADLYFTLWAHRYTPFVEGNPVASSLLSQQAYGGVVLLKLASVVSGSLIFWKLRCYARAEMGLALVMVLMVSLSLTWSRYTRIAQSEPDWIQLANDPFRNLVYIPNPDLETALNTPDR